MYCDLPLLWQLLNAPGGYNLCQYSYPALYLHHESEQVCVEPRTSALSMRIMLMRIITNEYKKHI